ncbi:hypothetical protein [Hymenobacter setariae]|nr:hypothetical protein [Hymenobacter setariae]
MSHPSHRSPSPGEAAGQGPATTTRLYRRLPVLLPRPLAFSSTAFSSLAG